MLDVNALLNHYEAVAKESSIEELLEMLTSDPFCVNISNIQMIILTEIVKKMVNNEEK